MPDQKLEVPFRAGFPLVAVEDCSHALYSRISRSIDERIYSCAPIYLLLTIVQVCPQSVA